MRKFISKLKKNVFRWFNNLIVRIRNKKKVFCIGFNKTGTTSLFETFVTLGYIVGNQRESELMTLDFLSGNSKKIKHYCKSGEFFQDIPFSIENTYKTIDIMFPNSKFILTIRDSPEQWYNSLVSFHSKYFGKGNLPTEEDMKNSNYVYKGWSWEVMSKMYGISENEELYNKDKLIEKYTRHIADVKEYFKNRPNDLLIINLNEPESFAKFIKFVEIKTELSNFPWLNKTSELNV